MFEKIKYKVNIIWKVMTCSQGIAITRQKDGSCIVFYSVNPAFAVVGFKQLQEELEAIPEIEEMLGLFDYLQSQGDIKNDESLREGFEESLKRWRNQ